jgi:hypothetical protein
VPVRGLLSLGYVTVRELLPTVADSLARYRERVGQLAEVFTAPLPNSAGLQRSFEELERAFARARGSGSRADEDSEKIAFMIKAGQKSAGRLGRRDSANWDSIMTDVEMVSVVAKSLSIASCQRSEFAKSFYMESDAVVARLLSQTERAEREAVTAVSSRALFEASIMAASTSLALAEEQFKNGDKEAAVSSVSKAKAGLSLVERVSLSAEQARALNTTQAVLDGCISWIKRGGELQEDKGPPLPRINRRPGKPLSLDPTPEIELTMPKPPPVILRDIAYSPGSPRVFRAGLWSTVRKVLADHLPESNTTRVFACIVLVSPILIGYSDSRVRAGLINDVLPNLFPEGKKDRSEASVRAAAEILADVNL